MAKSNVQAQIIVDKINQDISDCILALKVQFEDDTVPITDDNLTLQKFCAKLEFLLQHNLRDKFTILGTKKNYWDYFCQCLTSSRKHSHDGIRFVKLKSELKTSCGKGRAFLRFCLSHGCLADSLQRCFSQTEITRDWYYDEAIPCESSKWETLVSSLYDLNNIHFDLSSDCHELDISWPTFSRKRIDSHFSWKPPSRSVSISSLVSQIDTSMINSSFYEPDMGNANQTSEHQNEGNLNDTDISNIQQRNMELERRETELLNEIKELRSLSESCNKITTNEAEEITNQFTTKVELLTLQHASRERYFAEAERMATEKITILETHNNSLEEKLREDEQLISVLKGTVTANESSLTTALENINSLKKDNLELLAKLTESDTTHGRMQSEIERLKETVETVEKQLLETECKFRQSETSKNDLLEKYSELTSSNEGLMSSAFESADCTSSLKGELSNLTINLEVSQDTLKEKEEELELFVEKTQALEIKLEEKEKEIAEKSNEFESAKVFIKDLKEILTVLPSRNNDSNEAEFITKATENVNFSLYEDIKVLTQSLQAKSNKLSKENNKLSKLVEKLELSNSTMEKEMRENNTALNEANQKLQFYNHYGNLLTPLINQQDSTVDELRKNTDVILKSGCRLETDMRKLAAVIERLAKSSKIELEFPSLANSSFSVIEKGEKIPDISECCDYPIVKTTASVLGKLQGLLIKKNRIEKLVTIIQSLCRDITAFAVEKEQKMISKRLILIQTANVVETLVKEHKKVQAAERILKYELQEKRKMLKRLRQQLETTREEWNKVRLRNVESEAEWQSLRNDFATRYKQASEESGIVEDRSAEESFVENVSPSSTSNLCPVPEGDSSINKPETDETDSSIDIPSTSTQSDVPDETPEIVPETVPETGRPRRRLEILEEQCNLLYFSLLHSSKRSELLEQRLQILLGNPSSEDNSAASDSGAVKSNFAVSRQSPDGATEESDLSNDGIFEEDNESGNSLADHLDTNLDEIPEWENPIEPTINVISEIDEESINEQSAEENGIDIDDLSQSKDIENEHDYKIVNCRKKMMENIVTKFKSERTARESHELEMRARIKTLEITNASLEEKVMKLQRENTQVSSKGVDFRKRAEYIFRKEREAFELKVQAAASERLEMQKIICELKDQLSQDEQKLSDCQNSLELCQKKKDEIETSLSREISSLRFQLSTEALKYERALKHYTGQESELKEMRERINHQEQIIMTLDETLAEIKEERNIEKDKRISEFEELEMALSTRDEECSSLNEDLKKTTKELDGVKTYLAQLEEQSHNVEKCYKNKMEQLLRETKELITDNEDLKCQVIKLTKDKDLLWKKSEHLSRSLMASSGDRWMSDNEVIECLGCKATFGFTLRKHHCRLCGRIFCHTCAAHWVMTAASSRRSRVCNECFQQLGEKELVWKEPPHEAHEEEAIDVLDCDNLSIDSQPIAIVGHCESETSLESDLEENISGRGESVTPNESSAAENISGLDFDVISDEEIVRSLSACSPYSPSVGNLSDERIVPKCAIKSVREIEEAGPEGLMGEVWINAGDTYTVPIVIEVSGISLSWEFFSEPKSIAFSVAYKVDEDSSDQSQTVLLNTTKVQSHLHPVQGHLVAKDTGVYLLIFDNHFSRFMAKKVSYCLKILSDNM